MKFDLVKIDLPDFGLPQKDVVISEQTYLNRYERLYALMKKFNIDFLVVYGDREHFANVCYLTGYDPRFEETILIVPYSQKPTILLGNEGINYSQVIKIDINRVLYQELSLEGQPRNKSLSLYEIFKQTGISDKSRIGVVGHKNYYLVENQESKYYFDVPAYIIDVLRKIVSTKEQIFNAVDLFIHPDYGLRIYNEAEQLAAFEFSACFSSEAVKRLIFNLKPGTSELESVETMHLNGLPWSCHFMLSSGERTKLGLASPSFKKINVGEQIVVAFGLWGALNCRAGFVAYNENDLPENFKDYVQNLVIPYFKSVTLWYENLHIGQSCGELYEIIENSFEKNYNGMFVNPSHFIHLDEWPNSAFVKGSKTKIASGMMLQTDFIPVSDKGYTTNIEDTIAIADENLRCELAEKYPETWVRIQKRREFMREVLGIKISEDVLPFSNIPAFLPPFWLSPNRVIVKV